MVENMFLIKYTKELIPSIDIASNAAPIFFIGAVTLPLCSFRCQRAWRKRGDKKIRYEN